jgi:hypothetical protein
MVPFQPMHTHISDPIVGELDTIEVRIGILKENNFRSMISQHYLFNESKMKSIRRLQSLQTKVYFQKKIVMV